MIKLYTKRSIAIGIVMMMGMGVLTGCGASTANGVEDTESEELSTTGMKMLVDLDNEKLAVKMPDGLENETDLKTDDLESDDNILFYKRYTAYRPEVDYSAASVSEMLFDIFVEEADTDVTEAEFLDQVTISLAMQYSDLSRQDNETYGDLEYRVLSYTGTATDGTGYTCYIRMTVCDGFFVMFRALEYSESYLYIAYEDMADIYEEVYSSVIVQKM